MNDLVVRFMYYYLDENRAPVGTNDIIEMMQHSAGRITEATAKTVIEWKRYRAEISTVFLGLDHNHSGQGLPILWETMIFGNVGMNEYQWRYSSEQDAEAGHRVITLSVMRSIIAPTQRKRRLCARSGRHGAVLTASDGSAVCARCGKTLSIGAIYRKVIDHDREGHLSGKIRRRRRNYRRNLMRNFRKPRR